MKYFRFILAAVAALALFFCAGCGGETAVGSYVRPTVPGFDKTVAGTLEVRVLKVGKADSIVITTAAKVMVIDCGNVGDGGKSLDYLNSIGRTSIDWLIITHFDKDHVGGAEAVLQNMPVKQIYQPDYVGTRPEYTAYVNAAEAAGAPITKLKAGQDLNFAMDDVQVNIDPPERATYPGSTAKEDEADNDYSLCTTLWHGNMTLVFAGDAYQDRLKELVNRGGMKVDFLKVPHHGVMDASSKAYFDALRPTYAAICDSSKNPADPQLVKLLTDIGTKVYDTKDGSVDVVSDGQKLTVTQISS